jgi:hypothetical protein
MAGDPLGIPVWVKRRGNDKAAAILQQWEFGVDEPGQELTITLNNMGAPIAPRKSKNMTPEEYALQHKDLNAQLALVDINAKQLKKAARAARRQTLIENTSMVKHRVDVGWTLLASIAITAFSILAMFGKLPF